MNHKLSRRQFLRNLAVAAGSTVLTACAPKPTATPVPPTPTAVPATPEPVTITNIVFSQGINEEAVNATLAEFVKVNPNITVEYQAIPANNWGAYFDKLATQIAGGNPPDTTHVAIEGARLVVSRDLAMPLDDFMAGDPEIDEFLKECPPKLLEPFVIDGKTYELPTGWNCMMMFYNTKMFGEAGLQPPEKDWTKDQWLEVAQRLTKKSTAGDTEVFGYGFAVQCFTASIPWLFSNATSFLTDDLSESNLKDPRVEEVLQFLQDLVWKYEVAPQPPASHYDIYSMFAAGKIAMTGSGPWMVGGFARGGFQDYDIQYWPTWKEQATVFGPGGAMMLKSTKHPEAAWAWMKFLVSKTYQTMLAGAGGGMPSLRSVAHSDIMARDTPKNSGIFWDSIEGNAKPVPAPPNYSEVEAIWLRYLGLVLANEMTPADAVEQADVEISAALKTA